MIEILLAAVVFAPGARTTLLRDADAPQPDFRWRLFRLAKSQPAFWTVLVIGSYTYVYFAQGICVGGLNNTALLLLGIVAATTALTAGAKPVNAASPAPLDPHPPSRHENFLDDMLSENEGVNVHRLQMVLLTVVCGGIFIHQVLNGGKIPAFYDQACVLMGISSATYVWFKRTEK